MDSTELRDAFRDEMGDTAPPYLWSDAAIFRYLDDAQKTFYRLTDGIEDARSPEHTRLVVAAGEEWLPTSPLILKIRSATNAATGRPLDVIPMEKAPQRGIAFDGRVGPGRCLVSGFEKHALRLWPVPNEAMTVQLNVFRLPKIRIDGEDMELEVDEQHHEALLLWMKHLGYGKQDSETFDRSKSDEYEQRFRAYCYQATKEQHRARHPAGVVTYGGL